MSITRINHAATDFIMFNGGSVSKTDSGRTAISMPDPWVCVQGTWTNPSMDGVAVINGGGIPLVIETYLAEPGWVLAAVCNGVRQSIGDAGAGIKDSDEKLAKILARAETLAPGLAGNWGRTERAAPLADPLRAAILAILTGKISRFGADAPKFKGTTSEMLAIFREFGETKLGKPLGEPEWAEIERKIREEAAAILTAAGDQDDVFG